MTKNLFAIGLLAMVAFASCSKDDDNTVPTPEPVAKPVLFEDFEKGVDKAPASAITGWTTVKEKGELTWNTVIFDKNAAAEVSAYKFATAGDNITWLVSPALNLADTKVKNVVYDIAFGFWVETSPLEVYVMTDAVPANGKPELVAAGNPLTSTSVKNGWYTATIDLSKYTGKVYIGFKFSGNNATNASSTFRIDNFRFGYTNVKGDVSATPLNVTEALALQDRSCKWVKGYVVGTAIMATSGYTIKTTGVTEKEATNILLAATATETDPAKCLAVQLPAGTSRDGLNLFANPTLLGKEVSVKGMLNAYFNKPGLKNAAEFVK